MQKCIECNYFLNYDTFNYSVYEFGLPLCRQCQNWLREIKHETTEQTLDLYFELKKRGVPAEIEKFDGFKTIDIAVPEAKVNIEVDGKHHNFNPHQALADLKRTYYAFRKGFLTLRIPNSLIEYHLDETADLITDFLNETRIKNYRY